MNGKIKETFDKIHAEEPLKEKTKAFLAQKTQGYTQHKSRQMRNYSYLVSAAVCLVLMFVGSRWLYFTPTTEISIDINPSIELGINRLTRLFQSVDIMLTGRSWQIPFILNLRIMGKRSARY